MADGPGKYDDLATYCRQKTNAQATLVLVLGGDKGSGFSVQMVECAEMAIVPELLRDMAAQIARDMAAQVEEKRTPSPAPQALEAVELYAMVGLDETGTGVWGLKQGLVPAGMIPMVSTDRHKIEKYFHQFEAMAKRFGKKIRLCRFELAEVVRETEHGGDV